MLARERQALSDVKAKLHAEDWGLQTPPFIAGYSPLAAKLEALTRFQLERAILFPLRLRQSAWNSWVQRTYVFRQKQAETALQVTVIVDRHGSAGAVDGLLLHLLQAQRERLLFVSEASASAGVDIHERDSNARHLLRHNIGISVEALGDSVEGLGVADEMVPKLAGEIGNNLSNQATESSLAASSAMPKIVRFATAADVVAPGGETGIVLEISDAHPPVTVNFQTDIGSVNVQAAPEPRRYFRAGAAPGQGKISVIAVNELNLSAVADCLIDIRPSSKPG